jgi:cytoplasmic iron level regulating protein YaaA (DUF328/UPF0246 family)
MIFLLPPSESKQPGGKSSKIQLGFPALDSTRSSIRKALIELSKNPKAAATALKLGPKQLGELQVNLDLAKPKTMPAIDRYTGVLYDALKLDGLCASQLKKAKQSVFIQSSLFGLIGALDEIPNYRLSAGSKLVGINLRALWSKAHEELWPQFRDETVIDLRSKAYAQLAPLPDWINSFEVEVVSEDAKGVRKALNHFNKQAKGSFVRACLSTASRVNRPSELKAIARDAGLKLEIQGKTVLLITNF